MLSGKRQTSQCVAPIEWSLSIYHFRKKANKQNKTNNNYILPWCNMKILVHSSQFEKNQGNIDVVPTMTTKIIGDKNNM